MLNNKKLIIISSISVFIILMVLFFIVILDNRIVIKKNKDYLYADKLSTVFYRISYANRLKSLFSDFNCKFEIKEVNNLNKVKVIKASNGFYIQSGIIPCSLEFEVVIDKKEIKEKLEIISDYEDFNKDGFPDVAELVFRKRTGRALSIGLLL